jgi:hypothetical protein
MSSILIVTVICYISGNFSKFLEGGGGGGGGGKGLFHES